MLGRRGPGRAQRGDPAGAPVRPRAGAQPAQPSASAARAYHRRPRPAMYGRTSTSTIWPSCICAPSRTLRRARSTSPRAARRLGAIWRLALAGPSGSQASRRRCRLRSRPPTRHRSGHELANALATTINPLDYSRSTIARRTAGGTGHLHLANRRAQSIQVPLEFGPLCCPLLRLLELSL